MKKDQLAPHLYPVPCEPPGGVDTVVDEKESLTIKQQLRTDVVKSTGTDEKSTRSSKRRSHMVDSEAKPIVIAPKAAMEPIV